MEMPGIRTFPDQIPLAHSLAHNRRIWRILADKYGRKSYTSGNKKTLENITFPKVLMIPKEVGEKWRRRELNPGPVALQRRLLRV